MNRQPPVRVAAIAVLLGAGAAACVRHPAAAANSGAAVAPIAATVTIDPGERHPTLEGFAASVAGHLHTITDKNTPAGIYDLLFPELGLDILRLRDRYARSKPEDGD